MARSVVPVIAALGFACAPTFAEDRPVSDTAADGFVSLFNGKDLSGWRVREGQEADWEAKGASLHCAAKDGSWLQTSKMYSDFVLKIEYRLGPGGQGGVGLRIPIDGIPAHAGMKVQIVNDDSAAQATGAVEEQAVSKRGVSKPAGEWNVFEITCRGPQVKVELNGAVVNEFLVDQSTKNGSGRVPLCDRPGIGFIALEGRGATIDFRSLAVKDLTATTRSERVRSYRTSQRLSCATLADWPTAQNSIRRTKTIRRARECWRWKT